MKNLYADRMELVKPSAIRMLLKLASDPEIITFGGGYPDPRLFPYNDLNDIYNNLLSGLDMQVLQYSHSTGLPILRNQIAERMQNDGVICTDENIIILHGGQQGLDLVARLFLNKNDIVAVEDPTFLGGIIAFNPYEPEYLSVPMDSCGLSVDALEIELKKDKRIKFLYTIPDFHNPTGITMSLERRHALMKLANKYDFYILEDSPYRDIRFEGDNLPTLKSLDTQDRVIYVGSFSKILAPGLRLGWAVASVDIVDKLAMLKLAADTQSSTLNMYAVSSFLKKYDINKHINEINKIYAQKKNTMINAMQELLPNEIEFTNPKGGLFTWLKFPNGIDTESFLIEKAIPNGKVTYVPGSPFFAREPQKNYARFSYATNPDNVIIEGIERLANVLKK